MIEELCSRCGKPGAKERLVTRSFGEGDSFFVIENLPVISCRHCGESYMTTETMRKLDQIRMDKARFTTQRSVPIATFS